MRKFSGTAPTIAVTNLPNIFAMIGPAPGNRVHRHRTGEHNWIPLCP